MQVLPVLLERHHLDHSCILSVKLWLVIRCHVLVRTTKHIGKMTENCCDIVHCRDEATRRLWGVDPQFQYIRVAKKKRHFDELATQYRSTVFRHFHFRNERESTERKDRRMEK